MTEYIAFEAEDGRIFRFALTNIFLISSAKNDRMTANFDLTVMYRDKESLEIKNITKDDLSKIKEQIPEFSPSKKKKSKEARRIPKDERIKPVPVILMKHKLDNGEKVWLNLETDIVFRKSEGEIEAYGMLRDGEIRPFDVWQITWLEENKIKYVND